MKVDVNELVRILRLPTEELFDELAKSPYAIVGERYVLWYKGSGLPCLVAHVDHVYNEVEWDKRPILYNAEYVWSPMGTAGDDRCGVYALMQLFNELEVNALFCDLEEKGGVGAREACGCKELEETPYFIEIDRRNNREAVFYNFEEYDVPEFVNVISKYFTVAQGSFSDVSILGSHFGVCSTNLSAGYFNEHQRGAEYIYIPALEYTMSMVPKLIEELGNEKYALPEVSFTHYSYWYRGRNSKKGKSGKQESFLWWYDEAYKAEVEEGEDGECPIECKDCGSLEWDRWNGYYCWELDDEPNPDSPKCLKKRLREWEPWI